MNIIGVSTCAIDKTSVVQLYHIVLATVLAASGSSASATSARAVRYPQPDFRRAHGVRPSFTVPWLHEVSFHLICAHLRFF